VYGDAVSPGQFRQNRRSHGIGFHRPPGLSNRSDVIDIHS